MNYITLEYFYSRLNIKISFEEAIKLFNSIMKSNRFSNSRDTLSKSEAYVIVSILRNKGYLFNNTVLNEFNVY